MGKISQYLTARNLYQIFIHAALVLLAVEVVILAGQNREFKRGAAYAVTPLKIGDFFSLDSLEEVQHTLNIDTTCNHLVYVFDTKCPFCKKNLDAWRKLAEVAKEKNTSVIGISLDSKEKTVAYLSDNGIKYEVHVARNAEAFRRQNRITGIPQTIFRSPLGTVKKIWGGLLPENGVEEIAEAISQNRL